jgi:hypothetical protein
MRRISSIWSGTGVRRSGGRRVAAILFLLALFLPGGGAAQDQARAKNRALLELIRRFLAAPLDDRLRTEVDDSAGHRKDILVELSNQVNPWTCYGDTARQILTLDSALTTAFVASNMEEQLEQGRRGDRPGAGLAGVLRVYAAIRDSVPTYFVPEVDQWLRAQEAGRLAPLGDSLKYAPARDCPAEPPRRYRGRVRIRSVPTPSDSSRPFPE